MTRPSVLISAVSAPYNKPFLPYIWALLKTYWERHSDAAEAYEWLPPIFLNDEPEALLQTYDLSSLSVLGLSCYTWNFRLQCALAERAKAANPDLVVIAGGPEPDCKDGQFFVRHPYVDVVVEKDGEATFTNILSHLLAGNRDLSGIPGLRLPTADGTGMTWTGKAIVPTTFTESAYLAQSEHFEALTKGLPSFSASWETTRGCPYSCSFCDWGSSTMSKIRRVELDVIKAELEWFGRIGVDYLISVDANFGILPRDVEIAEELCDVHRRKGFPKLFYYSAAKNNPDRALAIASTLAAVGLARSHILALQHTRPDVLAATARENISPAKQVEVARTLMARRIPIDVQLIAGIPGDNYEEWSACLGDLMEWGIHEDYTIFFYNLLPNAPAAALDFQKAWEIQTVDRVVLPDPDHAWVGKPLGPVRTPVSHIVVQSRSYSRSDWIRMCTYGAFVKALHCGSLTRLVAMYLRWTHGVSYVDFYRDLIGHCMTSVDPLSALYAGVSRTYARFIEEEGTVEFMYLNKVGTYPYAMDPSRWVFSNFCIDFPLHSAALRAYLIQRYPQAPLLASLINYQFNLTIRPDYDYRRGAEFTTDYDWVEYFKDANGRVGSDPQPEPRHLGSALVRISDTHVGDELGRRHMLMAWQEPDDEKRWRQWVECVVTQRHSARTRNFHHISLEQLATV